MISSSGRASRAPRTSGRNCAASSGAPPVMSSVRRLGVLATSSTTRAASAALSVSERFGDDSTWQCPQAWLQ